MEPFYRFVIAALRSAFTPLTSLLEITTHLFSLIPCFNVAVIGNVFNFRLSPISPFFLKRFLFQLLLKEYGCLFDSRLE